jgi:hypothetical protein
MQISANGAAIAVGSDDSYVYYFAVEVVWSLSLLLVAGSGL